MCRGFAWQEPPAVYSARKRIAEKRVRGKQKRDGTNSIALLLTFRTCPMILFPARRVSRCFRKKSLF